MLIQIEKKEGIYLSANNTKPQFKQKETFKEFGIINLSRFDYIYYKKSTMFDNEKSLGYTKEDFWDKNRENRKTNVFIITFVKTSFQGDIERSIYFTEKAKNEFDKVKSSIEKYQM